MKLSVSHKKVKGKSKSARVNFAFMLRTAQDIRGEEALNARGDFKPSKPAPLMSCAVRGIAPYRLFIRLFEAYLAGIS
jgi:hypothetical protein